MALEIMTHTINFDKPTKDFVFSGPVKQYTVGITGFNMSYPDAKGHDVQTCSVSIAANQLTDNTLSIKITGVLSDNGGNELDATPSWVTVGVIAETDSISNNVSLANATAIPSGEDSAGIPLAGTTTSINVGMLSGFYMSYGTGNDHDIQTINASTTVSSNGSGIDYIHAEGLMKDGGSNSAPTVTIDGCLVATFKSNAGVIVKPITDLQTSDTKSVDMAELIPEGYKLKEATALLTSYQISYGGTKGNDTNSMGAGLVSDGGYDGILAVAGRPSIDGTTVKLPGPQSFMYDLGWPSNHAQDDSSSSVDFAVIATIVPV